MFVNCKHCNALVATDPATDLPPERCPRCAGVLRRVQAPEAPPAVAVPTPMVEAVAPATPQAPAPASRDAPVIEETAPVEPHPDDDAAREVVPTVSSLLREPEPPPDTTPTLVEDLRRVPSGQEVAPVDDARTDAAPVEARGDAVAPAVDMPDDGIRPAGTDDTPAAADAHPASDALRVETATAPDDDASTPTLTPAPASVPAPVPVPAPPAHARNEVSTSPGFVSRGVMAARPQPTGPRRWLPHAAIAGLALLLGLQVLLADRERLAADARWRPLVASLCGVFGCALAPWHQPAAFVLVTREVRPHPRTPGALRVHARFRNDAPWPQAWPRVLLTLSDVDGRPVAARAFAVEDYLATPVKTALVEPGQMVDIALDIVEPDTPTVSYAFDFR